MSLKMIENFFYRNPFLTEKRDIMIVASARRKKKDDGKWWNPYLDPLHLTTDLDMIHIETPYRREHKRPARTDGLRYTDLIDYAGVLQKKFRIKRCSLSTEITNRLREVETEILDEFDTNVDLVGIVQSNLNDRVATLWSYKKLLEKADPNVVVITPSYGKETLVEACKSKDIPVAELQHGVIHESHYSYSFPGPRTKKMFPDYLLVWGVHWKNRVEYPIPSERVLPVGYPYLEYEKARFEDIQAKNQILFISQPRIGESLSKFALELNKHPEIDHSVIFKTHPMVGDSWPKSYPWLRGSGIEVVSDADKQLYELFAESSVQIGVGSTAVYEGLCFNLETYVYDIDGSETLSPLIDDGVAKYVDNPEELVGYIGGGGLSFDCERYFAKNPTKNIEKTLRSIAGSQDAK